MQQLEIISKLTRYLCSDNKKHFKFSFLLQMPRLLPANRRNSSVVQGFTPQRMPENFGISFVQLYLSIIRHLAANLNHYFLTVFACARIEYVGSALHY
jgi:hypothetical protein